MLRRTFLASLLATPAFAQSPWPSQPVRLIVPFAAGGPTDIVARLYAEEVSKQLPQRVVVENRTGAGVVVGSDLVAKAPKDGLTLLYNTVAHSVLRALFPRLPFDPIADFAPIALLGQIPLMMLVPKDSPATTMQELIAMLRANPGKYDYASSGNGGAVHLGTELFLRRAGLRANHIPYRGSSQAMPDLLTGRVAMYLDVAAAALGYAARGDVRALGVSSGERIPQAPQLPTFAEAGVANAESYTWHMVLAPAGTPPEVVQAANLAFNRVSQQPEVRAKLTEMAMLVRTDTTPETTRAYLLSEIAKWEAIIRDAGIKAD
jgi:tripartite-type tricarboxylate transporter receptor subunit TctC